MSRAKMMKFTWLVVPSLVLPSTGLAQIGGREALAGLRAMQVTMGLVPNADSAGIDTVQLRTGLEQAVRGAGVQVRYDVHPVLMLELNLTHMSGSPVWAYSYRLTLNDSVQRSYERCGSTVMSGIVWDDGDLGVAAGGRLQEGIREAIGQVTNRFVSAWRGANGGR